MSENRNLMRDAVRDWTALGGPADAVFDLGACKGPIQRADGVCFASYDTLKGKPRERDGVETGIDRLEQVVAWLAGAEGEAVFEGVVVYDESHNASAALDTAGARGIRKASQRALAVVDLQDRLPNARVVYASATGATEVANLAYAARLGLWGRGTPFPTVEAFVEKVSAGGIAAMELVAKDLKSMGLYLARSVSYDGVDYRTLVHDLVPHQAQTYDRCAQAWQVVLGNIQDALEVTKADKCGRARAAAYSQFWGAHQRFFLHVLVSMSAPEPDPGHGGPAGRRRELRRATGVHDGGGDRAGLRQSGSQRRQPPGPRRDPRETNSCSSSRPASRLRSTRSTRTTTAASGAVPSKTRQATSCSRPRPWRRGTG